MQKRIVSLFYFLFLINLIANSQVNLNSGLMAYYPLNGNAGDSSGNGNHPSFNNATLTSDRFGNANSAYLFNGTSSYIQVPYNASLSSANTISISVWVKVNGFYQGTCHGNFVLTKGITGSTGSYEIQFNDRFFTNSQNCNNTPPNELFSSIDATAISSGSLYYVPKNKWENWVYTYNGSVIRLYVNGVLINSANNLTLSFNGVNDLFIGRYPTGFATPYYLNGVVDDIRIYNRALNTSEIAALYTPATTLPLSLVSFQGNVVNNKLTTLLFTTSNEVNSDKIIIERSYLGGSSFDVIGSVPSKGSSINDYVFTDYTLSNSYKNVFYRLKIVDKDGSFTYSNILNFSINSTSISSFVVLPNPAKNYASIQVNSKKEEATLLSVFDAAGKMVLSQAVNLSIGNNSIKLNNINTLKSGLYIFQLLINGEVATQKLIIE